METYQNPHDGCPSSPTTPSSSGSCTNSNTILSPPPPPPAATTPPPPLTHRPIPIPRSGDPNPFPTTFVQADTTSFKQVVQMLTGSADTAAKHTAAPPRSPIPPSPRPTGPKKQPFKLYERRGSFRHLKMIGPLLPSFPSPRKHPEILSPSILDLPSLVLSPVTPLIHDPWCSPRPPTSASPSSSSLSEEDRAIAERGFYLHPSPRTTPREAEPPRLLPLFPVTSPKITSAPSAAAGHQL